jgi:hypothetical protein
MTGNLEWQYINYLQVEARQMLRQASLADWNNFFELPKMER